MKQNIAIGSFEKLYEDEEVYVLKAQNTEAEEQSFQQAVDKTHIQFHFCAKGSAQFLFNQGRYQLQVSDENSLLLYNTQLDLPINLVLAPSTSVLCIVMTITKFHSCFSNDAAHIPFLSNAFEEKVLCPRNYDTSYGSSFKSVDEF